MRHICYLLNVKKEHIDLKIEEDSVHILVNLSDNALLVQTIDRMKGVMILPIENIHHPASPIWGPKKDENGQTYYESDYTRQLCKNRVLIVDESHYGAQRNGRIAKILEAINSPLTYEKDIMKANNVYVLLVSATPFAELGINTNYKKVETLVPDASYFGVKQMIAKNRIINNRDLPIFKCTTVQSIGKELEGLLYHMKDKTGFIFIRENVKSPPSRQWVAMLKTYLNSLPVNPIDNLAKYTYFNFDGTTVGRNLKSGVLDSVLREYKKCVPLLLWKKCCARANNRKPSAVGIDAMLCYPPDRYVFIFVQEMLLAGDKIFNCLYEFFYILLGKTLDTAFVRMVVDIPYQNANAGKVDRLVQGFVGRCCGYNKADNNVYIVSNFDRIKAYADWIDGTEAPELPSF